jgi:O-antigen/teichoic acid export membrane protein
MGWAGTVLIVRSLSTGDWGRFSFIFGFLGLVSVVTDLGVGRIAIAALLAEQGDRRRAAGSYILLRTVLGVIGYGVAVGVVVVANYPPVVVRGTLVAGLVLVLATPSNGLEAVFQATFRLRSVAVAHALAQLGQLALTCAVVVAGGNLVLLTVPAVAYELVDLAYKVYRLPSDLRPRLNFDWVAWRHLLKEAVPLAVGGVLTVAFYRIDIVMLSKLDTFDATGVYGITYKFADLIHVASSSLTVAMMPLLVRAWPDHLPAFGRTFRRAFLLSTVVGVAAMVQFLLFARPAISLLYGERYGVAATAAKLVVAGEVVHFFTGLSLTTLIATGRHRQYPLVALVGVVLNVSLNLWLIPLLSYNGAAVATLITESIVAAALGAIVLRIPCTKPLPLAGAARCVVAGLGAAAVGVGTGQLMSWPLASTATAMSFAALIHVLRVAGPGGLRALMREEQDGPASTMPS